MPRIPVNPATFPKDIYQKWLNASNLCHEIYREIAGLESRLFGFWLTKCRCEPSIEKVRDRVAEKREELELADANASSLASWKEDIYLIFYQIYF